MDIIADSLDIMMCGSSGGGSSFQRTLLYDSGSPLTGSPADTDIELLDNITNYDALAVGIGTYNDNYNNNNPRYALCYQMWDVPDALANTLNCFQGYYRRWMNVSFTETTFRIQHGTDGSESQSCYPQIYRIYGYKF